MSPFQPDRRSRLLEVDPHHDEQVVPCLARDHGELPGIVEPGLRVMDGARSDHDEKAVAPAMEDVGHVLPRPGDERGDGLRDGQLLQQDCRRNQRLELTNAKVVGPVEHQATYGTSAPSEGKGQRARGQRRGERVEEG